MAKHIIETVTFKLNAGVDRADFIASAETMNDWVATRPGFVHRRLSCGPDGTWIEHIEWDTMENAKAAAAQIMSAPNNAGFLMAIDEGSVQMSHSELEVGVN